MPSTWLGLTIGYSGLSTYQAALNTTGNNISNVRTEGYTRQQVLQEASEALRCYTTYGMVGTGVTALGVQQVRNEYYDLKYWNNNSKYGKAYSTYYYMDQIQDIFEEENKSGITKSLSNLSAAMEELYKKPDDLSVRNQFVNSAESMAKYLNELSTGLENLQLDCNDEIKIKVDEINTIAQDIAVLNRQINLIELHGVTANELRDQRALLIDQLSSIASVEVIEGPVLSNMTDSNGEQVDTGATTMLIRIEGQTLVQDFEYNTLECVARKEKLNQSDAEGLYDVVWSNGQEFNMSSSSLGGELQALIQMRDGNNAENLQGTIKSVDNTTGKVVVENANITDISKMTMPESGIITLNYKQYTYSDFKYNDDGTYEFTITDPISDEEQAGMLSMDQYGEPRKVRVGNTVNALGIPYYQSKLNQFVRDYAQAFNDVHTKGQNLNGDAAGLFFTGNDIDASEFDFSDTQISSGTDTYYKLTAANIAVAGDLIKDPSLMATTANISAGVSQADLVEELQAMTDTPIIGSMTPMAFFEAVMSDISVQTELSKTLSDNHKNINDSIVNQRLSVSGVDEDEEGMNLIKFQNAYNLSAKLISVMSEIYDKLINETGV